MWSCNLDSKDISLFTSDNDITLFSKDILIKLNSIFNVNVKLDYYNEQVQVSKVGYLPIMSNVGSHLTLDIKVSACTGKIVQPAIKPEILNANDITILELLKLLDEKVDERGCDVQTKL